MCRPALDQPTKIFYSGSACMYPEHNQLDPDNPDCREESAYPQTLIRNMDGRNSLVRDSTSHIIATMVSLLGLLVITTFLVQKEPGKVEERKLQLQSAVKSLTSQRSVGLSRCGEMAFTDSFLPVH